MDKKSKQMLHNFFEDLLPDYTEEEIKLLTDNEEKVLEEEGIDVVEILAKVKHG